jgi:hypothetical protein
MSGDSSSATTKGMRWVVLIVVLGAAVVAVFLSMRPSTAVSRERLAEERAELLLEQSRKDSPPPVMPDPVVAPESPPTRGPIQTPPRR